MVKPVYPPGPPRTREEWVERKAALKAYKEEQKRVSAANFELQKQEAAADLRRKLEAAEASPDDTVDDSRDENARSAQDGDGDGDGDGSIRSDTVAVPKRLMRAETVLGNRTGRFILVLESSHDSRNQQAVLRTAEAMGVQRVHIIQAESEKNQDVAAKIVKGSIGWLTITRFADTAACIKSLKDEGAEIWATDLHPCAECLSNLTSAVPKKVAIVIGREADGVSPMMLDAADRRVYLEMHGFTSSYNLSVAAALVLQAMFMACPEARGDITIAEKNVLRRKWFTKLNKSKTDKGRFDKFCVMAEQGKMQGLPDGDLRNDDEHNVPRIPPKLRKKMLDRNEVTAYDSRLVAMAEAIENRGNNSSDK